MAEYYAAVAAAMVDGGDLFYFRLLGDKETFTSRLTFNFIFYSVTQCSGRVLIC